MIQKPLDPRISLEILLDIFRRLFLGNAQILTQTEGTDAVNDTEIDRLGVAPLQVRHLLERCVEHLGGGNPVNVLLHAVCFNELFVVGHMRQNPQLNLGVIRIHEKIPIPRHKHLTNPPSQLHAHGDVL